MTKLHVLLLVCFLAALGAGVCAGVLWERAHKPPQDWLADLNLPPEQREKIKNIWLEYTRTAGWQVKREQRETARKECEEAVKVLIPAEQKERYEAAMNAYYQKLDEIEKNSEKLKSETIEKIKALLPEAKRPLYDELRKKREERSKMKTDEKAPAAGAAKSNP